MTTSFLNDFDLGTCDLHVADVTKHYGDFSLAGVTLDVPRGSIVGLVGRNGAGKTTLMKIILGATLADGGHVELFGKDCATLDDAELAHLRERVGYVGATIAYPAGMRVRDVVRMYELSYPAFDHARCDALLSSLAIDVPRKRVSELSRGMGMKLQLACVLASGADLLLLDEPTSGLDPIVREELLDILRSWMEDERHSMLISSHITSDLEHLADYLVMIEQGQVALSCERDLISDVMGVAQLRAEELERVRASWPFGQEPLRVIDRGLYKSLLVPSRATFRELFPAYACDRASIDDVMTLIVKGKVS